MRVDRTMTKTGAVETFEGPSVADAAVTSRVSADALRGLTDPRWFVRRVDQIFERVFRA